MRVRGNCWSFKRQKRPSTSGNALKKTSRGTDFRSDLKQTPVSLFRIVATCAYLVLELVFVIHVANQPIVIHWTLLSSMLPLGHLQTCLLPSQAALRSKVQHKH